MFYSILMSANIDLIIFQQGGKWKNERKRLQW